MDALTTSLPSIAHTLPPLRSKLRPASYTGTGIMPTPANWRQMANDQKALDAAARQASVTNAAFAAIMKGGEVKRWDGLGRVTAPWDELKRDEELWSEDGDCYIHLAPRGHSRRGPAFRVRYDEIVARKCEPMFDLYSVPQLPEGPEYYESSESTKASDSPTLETGEGDSSTADFYRHGIKYDLYIPAPRNLNRDDAFRFHLCTRNFFAWMFEKPMVGGHLGGVLVDLLERMRVFRTVDSLNVKDIVDYLKKMGYSDFRECANHALGILFFAEHCQVLHLWRDAFVHCVGLNERLIFSSEFDPISRTSKALITRAKLEMDLRLDHAGLSLGSFLEEELTGKHLGISKDAQIHLDHFRSFLSSYYVNQLGYYPPLPSSKNNHSFSKELYRSMYFEFRDLYQYLVDDSSSTDGNSETQHSGGFNVAECIRSYDARYHYSSLPHTRPKLPTLTDLPQPRARKSMTALNTITSILGKSKKAENRPAILSALNKASNSGVSSGEASRLIEDYKAFEAQCVLRGDSKLSATEARKVRWLLIYATLQTLVSVTRAPKEVSDTSGVSYSLCCQLAGTPPWQTKDTSKAPSRIAASTSEDDSFLARSLTVSLQRTNRPSRTTNTELAAIEAKLRSTKPDELDVRRTVTITSAPSLSPSSSTPTTPSTTTTISSSTSTSVATSFPFQIPMSQPIPQRPRPNYSHIVLKGYGNGTTYKALHTDSHRSSGSDFSGPSTAASTTGAASASESGDTSPVDDMDHLSVTSSYYGDEADECNDAKKDNEAELVPDPLNVRKSVVLAKMEAVRFDGEGEPPSPIMGRFDDGTEVFERGNEELVRYVAA
ncbi:MAG: hypothetical protein M1814_004148 [Vezdaea aestivalis]|nr:MAG: hypothetical protein M1814_004148 [Vezdaea aestivalis]